MRTLFEIQTDTPAIWEDYSDRVVFDGLGAISYKAGRDGRPILSPPSVLTIDNRDGHFFTEPDAVGSVFASGWEGRRVRFKLEHGGQDAITIGTFRVTDEDGLRSGRDGWAQLRLESLAEELKRGDASEIAHGRGWYPDIPWTVAIQRTLKPEETGGIALPSDAIAFEETRRAISSAGRPGDRTSSGFDALRTRAADACFNEANGRFAFLTVEGGIWELEPTTGIYTEVSKSWTLANNRDALRIWWSQQSTGDGTYFVLTAPGNTAYGWGGFRERYAKGTSFNIYRTDQASAVGGAGASDSENVLTPCLVRDHINEKPDPLGNGGIGASGYNVYGMRVYGNEYYAFADNDSYHFGIRERREAILIPFAQYAYPLELRNFTVGAEIDEVEIFKVKRGHDWEAAPINAYSPDNDNRWTVGPNEGAGSSGRWATLNNRAGAGYYSFVLLDDDLTLTDLDPATWAHFYTGLKHSIGQGPMVDLSTDHRDGIAAYDGVYWLAYFRYNTATRTYRLICAFNDGSTQSEVEVAELKEHRLPTFVVCDITRPTDNRGQRGAIIYGWIDYDPQPIADHEVGPDTNANGTCVMAESGIDVCPVDTASHSAAPTFSAQGGTVVRFREFEDDAPLDRHNQGGTNEHISGRWTPIAIGFKRYLQDGLPNNRTHYNAVISCIDRAELEPYEPGTESYEQARAGTATYRLFYLHITIAGASAVEPYAYATSITDTRGPGVDIQHGSPLPWMGFSRLCRGRDGDEETNNTAQHVYAYSPADRGLYAFACDDTGLGRPAPVGHVQSTEIWFGPGTLAVGNDGDGDLEAPIVAGVTWPTFPGADFERLPNGNYQAWLYGPHHMGRVPLLDNKDTNKLTAIGKLADLADHVFLYGRDGVAELKAYPASDASADLTIRAPEHVGQAERSRTEIVNTSQRSVYDVHPGEISITRFLAPGSVFAAEPIVTGLGSYPLELELRCILAGRPSDASHYQSGRSPWRSRCLFGWRMTTARVKTQLAAAATGGYGFLAVESLEGIAIGDTVTLGLEDADIRITTIYPGNILALAEPLANSYSAGDAVHIDPSFTANWSHQLRRDESTGRYVGIAELLAGGNVGDRVIRVSTLEPFAPGTLIRIHPHGDDFVAGASTPDYLDAYRVKAVRSETMTGAYNELEIESLGSTPGGLVTAVSEGDPITCFVNIPPNSLIQRVGQSGIMVGLVGTATTADEEAGESPLAEGDLIRVVYPGLELKRNQHSRIFIADSDSVGTYGTRKAKRRTPNKYADRELSTILATRQVRRGASGRKRFKVPGIKMGDPAELEALVTLNPFDVVNYVDYRLMPNASGYSALCLVVDHVYHHRDASVDLVLEEIDSSAAGGRLLGENKTPIAADFKAAGDDGEVWLAWDKPEASDFDEVEIRWSTAGPIKDIDDGTQLGTYSAGTYSAKHTSLSNGTTYYYAAFVKTTASKVSAASHATATPAADLAAPTSLTATAGDEEISLAWTDPSGDDLAGVLVRYNEGSTYPTTADDGTGGGTAQAGAEAIAVTGLKNGIRYSFSLFAIDGTGSPSSAANVRGVPDFDPEEISDYIEANWCAHSILDDYASGDPIDDLADASSAGHDLTKYLDAYRPTLDHSHADFDDIAVVEHDYPGTPRLLKGTTNWDPLIEGGARGAMVIFVGALDVVSISYTPIAHYGAGNYYWYWRGNRIVVYEDASAGAPGGYALFTISGLTAGTPGIYAFRYLPAAEARGYSDANAETADGNDDGDAPDDVTGSPSIPISVGTVWATGNPLDGRWAQIILVSDADTGTLERLFTKLREKYPSLATNIDEHGGFTTGFDQGLDIDGPGFTNGFDQGCKAGT